MTDNWTVEWRHDGRPRLIAREVTDLKKALESILAYKTKLMELKVTFND